MRDIRCLLGFHDTKGGDFIYDNEVHGDFCVRKGCRYIKMWFTSLKYRDG